MYHIINRRIFDKLTALAVRNKTVDTDFSVVITLTLVVNIRYRQIYKQTLFE